jgi:hypothetical protein
VIDLRSEEKNADDSMHFKCESFSGEIDEKDLQFQKHNELRNSTPREIAIDLRTE